MNFSNALNLLNQGYHIRLDSWPANKWVYKGGDGFIYEKYLKFCKPKIYFRADDILKNDWIAIKPFYKE